MATQETTLSEELDEKIKVFAMAVALCDANPREANREEVERARREMYRASWRMRGIVVDVVRLSQRAWAREVTQGTDPGSNAHTKALRDLRRMDRAVVALYEGRITVMR